jgi:hypothetical protein
MPGNSKECRVRAEQCLKLARQATTERERQTFLRLYRSYNRLAVELEDAGVSLDTPKAEASSK